MKILVIHNSYLERGGEDQVVDSEIRMLEKFGHKVIFYKRTNKEIKRFSFFKKLNLLRKEISWSEDSYMKIKELVKKEKPDIAHIHNIFLLISPSVYYALSEEKIPIVQTLHNFRLICPNGILFRDGHVCEDCIGTSFTPSIIHSCCHDSLFLTLAFAKALNSHFKKRTFQDKIDAYIVLGKFSIDKFVKAGLPEKKIFIKPNFIDLKIEKRNNFQDFVLFVGRLVDYKGINTLLMAFKKLAHYNLKIIGDGPLYKKIKAELKNMPNITLIGRLPNDEAMECIRASSFVVFPSECYEATPRVVIECFSCGVPVLVSDRGFMAQNLQAEGAGLLFRAQDTEDLASKIKYIMENRELIVRMGECAFKLYKEKYTIEENYNILMDIYNKALQNSVG